MTTNKNIIEIKNLNLNFGNNQFSLKNVNFTIKQSAFHGFVGSNGAGKTTIIRTIIGLYQNYDGEIFVDESNIRNFNNKFKIGYVPEIAQFYKSVSVKQYIYEYGKLSNLNNQEITERLNKWEETLNLKDLLHKKAANLSSGQKKRVLLAQALISEPKIMILDEPASNLDPQSREELFNILKKLVVENGITVFISSHILDELNRFIDSVTIIEKGEILYSGTIAEYETQFSGSLSQKWILNTSDNQKAVELINKKIKNVQMVKDKIELRAENDEVQIVLSLLTKNKISILEFKESKVELIDLYFEKINKGGK